MPVKKDDPLYVIRKKIVNKKNAEPSKEQLKKKEKPVPSVIPSREFEKVLARSVELCKALVAARKAAGKDKSKELGGSYKRNASELGTLLTNIVATVRATATTVIDARTKAAMIAGAKLPKEAIKAAVDIVNQLNGAHRSIKSLNDAIGQEIKKSQRGLDPRSILGYLREIKGIYLNAESARVAADKLYKQWNTHINPTKKIERRSGLKQGPGVVPKFVVNPDVVVNGTAKSQQDKSTLVKLVKAKNVGAVSFPDPYTILWNYYGDKSLHLDNDVRNIIRYSIMFAAKSGKQPVLNTVLELYQNGDLLRDSKKGEQFHADKFNENFKSVLEALVRKMKKLPKLKEFVFDMYQRADDDLFQVAVNHLTRADSRGASLTDNARKQYIEACRNWFTTYLPVL